MARTNDPNDLTDIRILRRHQVIDRVGLCRAQIYSMIEQGKFPRQITLGVNSVGWVEAEINAWLKARIAERDKPLAVRRGKRQPRQHVAAAE